MNWWEGLPDSKKKYYKDEFENMFPYTTLVLTGKEKTLKKVFLAYANTFVGFQIGLYISNKENE